MDDRLETIKCEIDNGDYLRRVRPRVIAESILDFDPRTGTRRSKDEPDGQRLCLKPHNPQTHFLICR